MMPPVKLMCGGGWEKDGQNIRTQFPCLTTHFNSCLAVLYPGVHRHTLLGLRTSISDKAVRFDQGNRAVAVQPSADLS